ncbi:protein roadkill-like [Cydia amplana]|uniref:protein roadkill-like n=1 Tax=Cydia amplana TaxID=1869771 RepID=UPI002FE51B94
MSVPEKIAAAIPMQLLSGPAVKLVYTITCSGEKHTLVSIPFIVNNLIEIRFKWDYSKISAKKIKIVCSFSSKRLVSEKCTTINVDLRSDRLKYMKTDFCPPERWSDWECMAEITPQLLPNLSAYYYTTCDYYIAACKVKTDMISSKLYEDTDFTDFNLSTPDGSVAVHKACLAAHSDVFKRMLSGEWQETEEGQITLEGVTLETLQHLKEYIYMGRLPNDGLRPLLLLARCYLIEDLQERCINKLAQTARSEDLYSLHKFACENNIPELTFATLQLTRDSVISYANQVKKMKTSP